MSEREREGEGEGEAERHTHTERETEKRERERDAMRDQLERWCGMLTPAQQQIWKLPRY